MCKFYFNFPNANKSGKQQFAVHLKGKCKSIVFGNNKNGIVIEDFKIKSEMLFILKKIN